ncbi:MAG TPA: 16S rRNA (uracil(1498)-N(3))-methyltransferase [Anaerolineaceae bacterium]|nr:16S rRNA (uracil(1498)-N(3))-methyltransferase [Anaerolineaceae bacterium]
MHRFFVSADCIRAGQVTLTGPVAHQIQHVLRLRPKDQIVVIDTAGTEYTAELELVNAGEAVARVLSQQPARSEPGLRLTLYQSLVQREKFEWILQKCTEVGIAAIVPVLSERSLLRSWDPDDARKLPRWERILQEAAEQSHRGKVPGLRPPQSFAQAAAAAVREHDLCLIPWEEERSLNMRQALAQAQRPLRTLALFIGPEGGFTTEEASVARDLGIQPVTLGRRILRAETAAVVASALVLFQVGEME